MVRDFDDGVVTIVCHPEVIGRGHRLLMLEQLIDTLIDDGLEVAPLHEVAQTFRTGRAYGRYAPQRPAAAPNART